MKTLTPVFGLVLVSSLLAPLSAQAKPLFSSSPQPEKSSTSQQEPLVADTSASLPQKMAAYKDCMNLHTNVNGADFKDVNKFCSCVADQSIQGSTGNLSDCATASKGDGGGGGGGGGAMGVIGEVAPSVISGVMEGLSNRSSKGGGLFGGGGGGILGGLGDLFGGGGSSNDNNDKGGGFNLGDLLKNRF